MNPTRTARLCASVAGLAICAAGIVHAADNAPDRRELWVPSSELKAVLAAHPRAVLLSREQYEALLRDAGKTTDNSRLEPPLRATLASARYTGTLTNDVMDVRAEFTVNVLSDKWAAVPLRLGALALGDIKSDGDAVFTSDDDSTMLMIRGKGEHKVTAEFMLPVKKDSSVSSVQLSLPRSAASMFTFDVPAGTEVESSGPVDLKKNGATTTATLTLSAGNDAIVSWHGSGSSENAAAMLFQENSYLYTVDEDRVGADLGIVLNAALGNLSSPVKIAIPQGATPLQVVGNEVLKWSAVDNSITIDLTPGSHKTAAFRVLLETPSRLAPGQAALPLPVIEGVRRSAGKFAVIRSAGVKIRGIDAGAGAIQGEGLFDNAMEQSSSFVAGYGFAVQPAAIRVTVEKEAPRFSVDLDTLVDLQREAVFIERTLSVTSEEGEVFESNFAIPQEEELISIRNEDDSEPEWKTEGGKVKIQWSDGIAAGNHRVFKIKTRMEPPKWPDTDGLKLGDLKVDGAEKINGYLALKADKMFHVETADTEGLEKRDGRITPVKGDFAWFRRDTFELTLKLALRAAETQAVLLGYALPVDGALDIHGQINYSILYSGVKTLRVKVPAASAEQFYFDGDQIAERNRDGDTWTIVLQKEVTGDYALKFHAVVRFDESKANFQVDIPAVQPLDVKQEAGTWAIEANTSTEIVFKAQGMNELDPLHAPALADYQVQQHVIGVFGYLGADHSLRLEGTKHESAPIITAVADSLNLETVVSTSGAERHKATFMVRTAGDQFLDVTLPPESTIWSLTVDDEPSKPVSEKTDVVRVQLPATLDRTKATPVTLVYETRRREWSGSGGMAVVAPRLDPRIPILQSHWSLWLPDGFSYTAFDSNLRNQASPAAATPLLFKPFAWLWAPASTQTQNITFSTQQIDEAKSEQVERLCTEAGVLADSGRYDLAAKTYQSALDIDPGNVKAREALQKIATTKLNYDEQAYNTTRAVLNERVTHGWEIAPRKYDRNDIVRIDSGPNAATSTDYLKNKINSIILPRLEFRDASLRAAVDFLKKKSQELDTTETDPSRKGINIFIKMDSEPIPQPPVANGNGVPISPEETKITLSLTNIPLGVALDYVSKLAGMKLKIDPYAVIIVPLSESIDVLITREYKVPQEVLRRPDGSMPSARDYLEKSGVVFPPGASANYLPSSEKMVVRNTESNLDVVDQMFAPPDETLVSDKFARGTPTTRYLQEKLQRIIIPRIEFRDATVREAVDYLMKMAIEHDTTEPDPARRGFSIYLKLDNSSAVAPEAPAIPGVATAVPPNGGISPADAKITLSLTNIPVGVALDYVAKLANLKVKVEPYAVTIVPLSEPTDTLITREYRVPGFLGIRAGTAGIPNRTTAREYLENAGVVFPPGASVNYIPSTGKLVVRNTEANLDVVDQVTESFGGGGKADVAQAHQELEQATPSVSGILPMKLDFQHTGRKYSFDGLYAADFVKFHYLDWWSEARRNWILWLAGLVAFFAMGRTGPWRRLVWGSLLLTFIPACLAASMAEMCNALLAGWIGAFVIHQLATKIVFRRRATEAVTA